MRTRKIPSKIMTDFLSRVQETEQQAAALLEKAIARKQSALRKYRADLLEEQKQKEDEAQENIKSMVQAARTDARRNYEAQVKAGEDEAKKIEREKAVLMETVLPEATNFLLEII